MSVGTLPPSPEALERSILREPPRWVPGPEPTGAGSAKRCGGGSGHPCCTVRHLRRGRTVCGTSSDAPSGRPKKRGLATQLIRRVSPTVRVHDLGLTSYDIGDRQCAPHGDPDGRPPHCCCTLSQGLTLPPTESRLWRLSGRTRRPKSALNSLHQTIFFLRRELEPWYEDGATADYVHMDTELVRLDTKICSKLTASHSPAKRRISSPQGSAGGRGLGDARLVPRTLRA